LSLYRHTQGCFQFVLGIAARLPHTWKRITAQNTLDLWTTVTASLRPFLIIVMQLAASPWAIAVLSSSPAATAIPVVLLTLLTQRDVVLSS
jgi:hypothetical protein